MKFDQVEVSERQYENSNTRYIDACGISVRDYAAKGRNFKSRQVNLFDVDLATIKQNTRTIGSGADKFKVKVISFTDNSGKEHEIALFS